MKFCTNCGNELIDDAVVCPKCGSIAGRIKTVGDSRSKAWAIISFLFPVLGLILYLVWRDDRPLRSSSILKGLRAGFIVMLIPIVVCLLLLIISYIGMLITTPSNIHGF